MTSKYRQELSELKHEAITYWMTKDGLTALQKHNGFVQECGNDNGILFTVLIYFHLHLLGLLDDSDRTRFVRTERQLQGPEKGLYNRGPGRTTRDEAHDNYKALVLGSVLFDYPQTVRDIISYGLHNGFIYENVKYEETVDPHLVERRQTWWYKWLGFDITRWRQGSDVAYYKLCAGMMPTPPQYLWFLIGIIFNMFQKIKDDKGVVRLNTDGTFLVWMQIEGILLKYTQMKVKPRWKSLYIPIKILYTIWKFVLEVKTEEKGLPAIFEGYFVPEHPIVRMSKCVKSGRIA